MANPTGWAWAKNFLKTAATTLATWYEGKKDETGNDVPAANKTHATQ
jgi:hypothetical protein